MDKIINYGVAWFYEEDWEEWKNISEDQLEENYQDWLISAQIAKSNLEKEFKHVEKVFIRPKEFKRWCKRNRKKLNSSSRSEYITTRMLSN